jgi:hypothetical protein
MDVSGQRTNHRRWILNQPRAPTGAGKVVIVLKVMPNTRWHSIQPPQILIHHSVRVLLLYPPGVSRISCEESCVVSVLAAKIRAPSARCGNILLLLGRGGIHAQCHSKSQRTTASRQLAPLLSKLAHKRWPAMACDGLRLSSYIVQSTPHTPRVSDRPLPVHSALTQSGVF